MHPLERHVRRFGGIASTAELLACGFDDEDIRMVVGYGRIRRIRHGWYGSRELPADAFRSWQVGGPLTCLSAAIHHGLWNGESDKLHVRLAGNCARVRLSAEEEDRVVLHWSRRPVTGTRLAVSVGEALETLKRCQPADLVAAIRRAANR
jgi:hypothetical protein